MLHEMYLCLDRMCSCVFYCLCLYEYVCASYMLPLSTWVFEMGLVWKITQNLIFGTFKLGYLWLRSYFRLPFQQRGLLHYCLCINKNKKKSQTTPINCLAVQMSAIFQESPFPLFFADFDWVPWKSIALII